jgi:replicative DNA helicase
MTDIPASLADLDGNDPVAGSEAWDTPVPLGAVPVLPAFPVGILPPWLRQEVTCLTEFAQVPADLAAVIALAVLAAAAGGRAVVEIRGSWREPLNLYAVTAMPPGSRKSAVFAELVQPLLDTEHNLVEKTAPQIIQAETERKVAQRDADKLAVKASNTEGDSRADAVANAIAAAQLAEAITVPVMPKLIADDVTPEAAASLLAEQGGRLAVLSAEGGCFSTLSGRYSGTPNLEVFLKGHSGDMLRVDRKGRPPEHIPRPALTLGLAVQPQVLRDIASMPGFRGRGLLARILYSIPPNTVGTRKIRTDPIPEDIRDTYAASIRALVLTLAEWDDPAVLMLTPEAAELLLTTAEELEPRLGPDGDLGHIADWASKLIGATARIAGLLHLAANLQDGWGKPISAGTMTAAVQAAGYFTAHALAAFDGMGADPVLQDARFILQWLKRTGPARFTKREAHMGLSRSRFPKVGDLDAPLALLEQHGYIRSEPEPERTGPGRRPSPAYAVHPDLATETTEYTQ